MTFLTEPFRGRTWREQAFALAALPVGTFWFCVLVTLLSTGASLAITIVGLPLLAATLWLAGAGGAAERAWARLTLGVEIPAPPAPAATAGSGFGRFLRSLVRADRWRAVLYLLLLFPLGIAEFCVAVTLWATAIAGVLAPLWVPLEPESDRPRIGGGPRVGDHGWEIGLAFALGAAVLLLTPWIVRALVRLHVSLLRTVAGAR